MLKIELNTDQIDRIVIKELKEAYKSLLNVGAQYPRFGEQSTLEALETVLCYYMVETEAIEWITRQKIKAGV